MALKRLGKNLKRVGTGIKKLERKRMTKHVPLSFLKPAPSPWRGFKEREKNEDNMRAEVEAVHSAMVDRLKQDQARKKLATASDDYFTVAFESGEQVDAFLRAVGYPQFKDAFVDGLILADLLKIELPVPKAKLKPLKTKHAESLTRLITNPKWKDPSA